jgi:hypothetical protein
MESYVSPMFGQAQKADKGGIDDSTVCDDHDEFARMCSSNARQLRIGAIDERDPALSSRGEGLMRCIARCR